MFLFKKKSPGTKNFKITLFWKSSVAATFTLPFIDKDDAEENAKARLAANPNSYDDYDVEEQ